MIHTSRRYKIVTTPSIAELAEKLTEHSWCLCNGFRLRPAVTGGPDLLFLNDAFTEDGAQEFAVINSTSGRQVDSLTCSWMTRAHCEMAIQRLAGGDTSGDMGTSLQPRCHGPLLRFGGSAAVPESWLACERTPLRARWA